MQGLGRRYLLRRTVKDAFDNLPSGICFFDSNGIAVLCNRQMDRLIYELKGFDVQCLSELQDIFSEHNSGSVVLVKGKAWRFRLDVISLNGVGYYTQVTATDVDELYRRQLQLEESSRKLERAGRRMRKLTENIRTVIREEEILGTAEVDGATDFQCFWRIKWPAIMPTTLYILVITTINSFQCFALIQLLTSGGPNHSTDTIMYYIYYTAFKLYRYGYGNAMGVVLAVIIAILSAVQFKFGSQDN